MKFTETPIAGLVAVELERRGDERGFFARAFCAEEFAAAGLPSSFGQANMSRTATAGTVRGVHYQLPPAAEDKFVRCTRGALFDVGVDLRAGSPTFGRWYGVVLDADEGNALLVPKGVAHAFQTLVDDTEALYMVSAPYAPELERGLRPDDPALGIEWPHPITVLSDKDRSWPDLTPDAAVHLA